MTSLPRASGSERGMECPVNTPFQSLQDEEFESGEHDENIDGDEKNLMKERIARKLRKDPGADVKSAGEGEAERRAVSRR